MAPHIIDEKAGFIELLGIEIIGLHCDKFTIQLEVQNKHLHSAGQVHGGVYMALLDTVMSRALHGLRGEKITAATAEMKSNFLRPCEKGIIRAEGWTVKAGKRLSYLAAELLDDRGKLLATATATFILIK
jgi:uncharacterized protein (TIGR00369 family)